MPLKLCVHLNDGICYFSGHISDILLRVSICIYQLTVNLLKLNLSRFKIISEQGSCIHGKKSKNQSTLHHESSLSDVVVDSSTRVSYEPSQKLSLQERNPLNRAPHIFHKTPQKLKSIGTKETLDNIRLTVYRGICSINEKIQKYQYLYRGKGVEINPEGSDALLVSNHSVISKLRVNLFAFDDSENVEFFPPVIIGEKKISDGTVLTSNLEANEDTLSGGGEDEYSDGEELALLQGEFDCDPIHRLRSVSAMLEIFFVGKEALMMMRRRKSIGHRRLHGIILVGILSRYQIITYI